MRWEMKIGNRIRALRQRQGLTQGELGERCELTKGFISQMERDLASPSIATFVDILEALGTDPEHFFRKQKEEKLVFSTEDFFESENEDLGYLLYYIVPNAQKNSMEPTKWEIQPGGKTKEIKPFEGETFALILNGTLLYHYGEREEVVKKNQTVYCGGNEVQFFSNPYKKKATILWVSNPPNF